MALLDQIRSGSTFPWNFIPKWPITRGERVGELEVLSHHYNKTPQKANVAAAIAWHSQFPPGERVPDDLVCFQGGKTVEQSQLEPEKGMVWDEVSKGYNPYSIAANQVLFRALAGTILWSGMDKGPQAPRPSVLLLPRKKRSVNSTREMTPAVICIRSEHYSSLSQLP